MMSMNDSNDSDYKVTINMLLTIVANFKECIHKNQKYFINFHKT